MNEKHQMYVNLTLDVKEQKILQFAKEQSGIKSTADLIRFVLMEYAKKQQKENGHV